MKTGKDIKLVAHNPPIERRISPDELSKLTSFFSLLIEIDKRNRKETSK